MSRCYSLIGPEKCKIWIFFFFLKAKQAEKCLKKRNILTTEVNIENIVEL